MGWMEGWEGMGWVMEGEKGVRGEGDGRMGGRMSRKRGEKGRKGGGWWAQAPAPTDWTMGWLRRRVVDWGFDRPDGLALAIYPRPRAMP